MNRPLGCLTGSGLIAAILASLTILAAAAASGNAIFSPGELNTQSGAAAIGRASSHGDLARQCAACHPAFWSGERMGDRCVACHAGVADQILLARFSTAAMPRRPIAATVIPNTRVGKRLFRERTCPVTPTSGQVTCSGLTR